MEEVMAEPAPDKNKGPLLVDKVRGYFQEIPDWLRRSVAIKTEKQKVDANVTILDPLVDGRIESELRQEVTDEKLKINRYFTTPGKDDISGFTWPQTHEEKLVIAGTGQVGTKSEIVSPVEQTLVEGPPLQDGRVDRLGDLYYKTEVTAPTFDKKVYQATKEDLMPAEFKASIAESLEQHTVDGSAVMPTLGTGETLKREEQQKAGVKETSVQRRDLTVTPTLLGQRVEPEYNGAILKLSKDIVADDTNITQGFGKVESKITAYDDEKAVREEWEVDAAGFPVLTQYNYDEELNKQVTTTVSIIAHGTAYTPVDGVLEYQERKIDAKHKMRVVNSVALPVANQTEYASQLFTYPGLLISLSFQLVAIAAVDRSETRWNSGVRAEYTVPTTVRVLTEYFTSLPVAFEPISWAGGDISFKGISYSVQFSNLLFDDLNSVGVTFANDALYGNAVDRFTVSATVPSASYYLNNWQGTEQIVACTVDRYKRLWRRKTTYAYMK
jgi:hypothetical protein